MKKYDGIIKYTKQIFIHNIKNFLLHKSDELFIFIFVSLKMVAYYGNYIMITTKIGQLFSSVLGSMEASVGNLVAEGNKSNIIKVFWELTTIRHFIAGILCFSIYHFIEPFIVLWLGKEYILSHSILILLVLSIYIGTSRGSVDMFNATHGLFADTWSAWVELVMNILITIVGGFYWGIAGILFSKVLTTSLIGLLWKPYYLFHSGLNLNYIIYWKGVIRNYAVSIISFYVAHILLYQINNDTLNSYWLWIQFCITGLVIYLAINLLFTYFFCKGTKDLLLRIPFLSRLIKK